MCSTHKWMFFERLEGGRKIDGLVYFPFVGFAKNFFRNKIFKSL